MFEDEKNLGMQRQQRRDAEERCPRAAWNGTSWMVNDYPDPPVGRPGQACAGCGEELANGAAWQVDGGAALCAECLARYIDEHYATEDLADELGFARVWWEV